LTETQTSTRLFSFGPFEFDGARGILTRAGEAVPLGGRALLVLQALLEGHGEIVDKARLLEIGWPGLVVEESNLSVQVAALRKLLGPSPGGGDWIVTVARLGYRFAGATLVPNARGSPTATASASSAGHRPSIAVLPFKNLSGDPAQEYFTDGIAEDVIAALTRFRWFRVTGRNPSFAYRSAQEDAQRVAAELGVRYLVQGSVRKSGPRVRISVELVEADGGEVLWADRYDFDATDVLEVQDRIARRVAASVEPELLQTTTGNAATRPRPGTVTGWDLVAQGCWYFHQIKPESHVKARELFRRAREVDPTLPEARFWLARVNAGSLAFNWADDPEEIKREGLEAAIEGVRMDEKNCYAHYGLAIMSVMSESFDDAIRAAERAVDLSPGLRARLHGAWHGAVLFRRCEGRDSGLRAGHRAQSPRSPQLHLVQPPGARAALQRRRPGRARACAHSTQGSARRTPRHGNRGGCLPRARACGGSAPMDRALDQDRATLGRLAAIPVARQPGVGGTDEAAARAADLGCPVTSAPSPVRAERAAERQGRLCIKG
jgi:TolB-like protein